MHRKHLILAVVCDRSISCHQCQHFPFIFALGNYRLFRFLQTLFVPFLKFIRPLLSSLRVFSKTSRYIFVLRLNFPGNKLHRFLTDWFVRWWFFTWTLRRGSFSVRELHQIGESCWSDADGACVRDRLLGRLLYDSRAYRYWW